MTINLFYNYFEHQNKERKKEIDFCLNKNLSNDKINTIIIESKEVLTYNFYFDKINKLTRDEDINIICNSDIFFDETIDKCLTMKDRQCYALARWEYYSDTNIKFSNRPDSQDVWIFRGHIRNISGDFNLGRPGCDNRIAHEIQKAGYLISNPSIDIKTYHVHASNIREYSVRNYNQKKIPGPYLTLSPCRLVG